MSVWLKCSNQWRGLKLIIHGVILIAASNRSAAGVQKAHQKREIGVTAYRESGCGYGGIKRKLKRHAGEKLRRAAALNGVAMRLYGLQLANG